ncbi:fused response regulator/phosphatase [Vogesella sp. LIG4]|uniref:fused response regulator/phosphatase n=1 Tax=Vogesella sp. LIG4 TaxID=1192162 RepID=UPI00081F804D|nr:fused response regulator/phosphatase [Vogesella sp. LIG4]SCK05313.1 Response regulator containing a CheY-like receiver domain and a GGDEF domain [Vogesella sp. LIG4]
MRQLNVLVVDDSKVNRLVIARLINNLGHLVTEANNGVEALAYCERQLPDLILMDVIMPEMDGLSTTRKLRARYTKQWIPIIFLTGKSDQEDVLAGLEAGGDDYLTKPVDTKLLAAKIRVMVRIAEMQQRITQDAKRLEAYYHANQMEQQLAEHVLDNLYGDRQEGALEQWIKPTVQFSGDIITVAKSPAGTLHFMLADSTGHGLAAAIACLPAATVFYAMTQKGFGIHAIAREINKKLKQQLPVGRFVAATLVAISPLERTVTVWNGGIPYAAFINEAGEVERRFDSTHPPLGILPNADFDPSVEVFRWSRPGRILVCSDGLTEALDGDGQPLDMADITALLAHKLADKVIDTVAAKVGSHLGRSENVDDISVVIAPCSNSHAPQPNQVQPASFTQLANWEIRLTFGPRELRDDLGMPTLLGWLNQIGLNEQQFSDMLLVVTELFTNALDHGLLALDSSDKDSSNGFTHYLTLRQQRLAALQEGRIQVAMRRDGDLLRLSVQDSGQGFDLNKLHSQPDNAKHGRGIALIHRLCRQVSYHDGGTRAEVAYQL